ncbi:MAG: hypothetical protein IJB79_04295, partial [Candidatus Gastranaerophilales bacterium]|nr:hypothetical protein [Candidatus Gastranaerophilales bacterium]
EGFDVFIHDGNELIDGHISKPYKSANMFGVWSQDNKFFINKDGKEILLSCQVYNEPEQEEAIELASLANIESWTTELVLDGGNVYIGKKKDGKNYFITTYDTLELCAGFQYLKSILGDDIDFKTYDKFLSKKTLKNKLTQKKASTKEYFENNDKWIKKALGVISEDFSVELEDIIIIPKPEYHIDLSIRPLEYPYILVDDDKLVDENLRKLEEEFGDELKFKIFKQRIKNKLKEKRETYSSSDEICKKLEEHGFIPIRIAGGYGLGNINFMNAIVHKNKGKLSYITNSAICGNIYLEYLQGLFEEDLRKKCPQIEKIYFIDGGMSKNNSNTILDYLKKYKGAIHCLCNEQMEE